MSKVKCNFCFETMEEDEFVTHAKEDHSEEIIDDCMTYSGILEYSTKVKYEN